MKELIKFINEKHSHWDLEDLLERLVDVFNSCDNEADVKEVFQVIGTAIDDSVEYRGGVIADTILKVAKRHNLP